MAPEYGATCGFFPIDDDTMRVSARHQPHAGAASSWSKAYAKAQGMYRTKTTPDPVFTDVLKLELASDRAVARRPEAPAGPRRAEGGQGGLHRPRWTRSSTRAPRWTKRVPVAGRKHDLGHGDVVIAAITSCTNTSNPERDGRRPACWPGRRSPRASR